MTSEATAPYSVPALTYEGVQVLKALLESLRLLEGVTDPNGHVGDLRYLIISEAKELLGRPPIVGRSDANEAAE